MTIFTTALTPLPIGVELAVLDAMDEILVTTELEDELLVELEALPGAMLLDTELLVAQVPATPKGEGWLVQVLREMQLLPFSYLPPLCVVTHNG